MNLEHILKGGDILLIVPPFVHTRIPSLGLHILQAQCKKAGYQAEIFYANQAFAALIGEENYLAILNSALIIQGEWIFSNAPFRTGSLNNSFKDYYTDHLAGHLNVNKKVIEAHIDSLGSGNRTFTLQEIKELQNKAHSFVDLVSSQTAKMNYKIVGCSNLYMQLFPGLSILNKIKEKNNAIFTVFGGFNMHGKMAEGIRKIAKGVDAVFEGESELTFIDVIKKKVKPGKRQDAVISSKTQMNLDEIGKPDYGSYVKQLNYFLQLENEELKKTFVLYEFSRGCSWGTKNACKFCHINGDFNKYRVKKREKIVSDLKDMLHDVPNRYLTIIDNILPLDISFDILENIKKEYPDLRILCSSRPQMTLKHMSRLKASGVFHLLTGIESLSPNLLQLMQKGISLYEIIKYLRYARSCAIQVTWYLLWGFPGDRYEDYLFMEELIPYLVHLQPPGRMRPIEITRFSSYYNEPEMFNIENMKAKSGYDMLCEDEKTAEEIDFYFFGNFESGSLENIEGINSLQKQVQKWKKLWNKPKDKTGKTGKTGIPRLEVIEMDNKYWLLDSRFGQAGKAVEISEELAKTMLVRRKLKKTAETEYAIRNKLILVENDYTIPLATAKVATLNRFENKSP